MACTPELTYYCVHPKRGKDAMDDDRSILPDYTGTAMHDGLPSYRKYKCGHALCNEHNHRELVAVAENDQQMWGQPMIDLLYEIKTMQKISGSFRSKKGAQIFCRIRGFVSTVRKQGFPILAKIEDAFASKPVIFAPPLTN